MPAARTTGALAAVLAVLWLWRHRRTAHVPGARRPPSLAGVLVRAGIIMAVFGLLLRFGPPPGTSADGTREPLGGRPGDQVSADAASLTRPAPPPPTAPLTEGFRPEGSVRVPDAEPTPPRPDDAQPSTDPPVLDLSFLRALGPWLIALFILGVVVMVFRLLRGGFRRAEGHEQDVDEPVADGKATATAEAGLIASLDELHRPRSGPRSQIAAAYRRLLDALESAGVGREPFEAPHEHLNRTLGSLGVRPGPLHRLAALYVAAEFGEGDIEDRHRAEAAEALEQSLADLKGAGAW